MRSAGRSADSRWRRVQRRALRRGYPPPPHRERRGSASIARPARWIGRWSGTVRRTPSAASCAPEREPSRSARPTSGPHADTALRVRAFAPNAVLRACIAWSVPFFYVGGGGGAAAVAPPEDVIGKLAGVAGKGVV